MDNIKNNYSYLFNKYQFNISNPKEEIEYILKKYILLIIN